MCKTPFIGCKSPPKLNRFANPVKASPKGDHSVFIYARDQGSLDTYSRGGKKEVSDLEAIFADIILDKRDLEPNPADPRVYDLDVLARRDFVFRFDEESGIERVVVRNLRMQYRYGSKAGFLVLGDYNRDENSVYVELEKLGRGIPLDQLQVTQAELGVHFAPVDNRQSRIVPARITRPNRCSLRYDGLELEARKMLVRSNLEPQFPEDDDGTE